MLDFWPTFLATHSSQDPAPAQTGLYPIRNMAIVEVSGPDSAKFMQGQFSCNINSLHGQQFSYGACCNAKGRMVTSFAICQTPHAEPNHYLLSMASDVVEITLGHLKKYKVFFKCTMSPAPYVLAGLKGPAAKAIIEAQFGVCPTEDYGQCHTALGSIIQLPFAAGYELWLPQDSAEQTLSALLSQCTLAPQHVWQANLINHGLAHVVAASSEQHIPQMLNMQAFNGISFNKGCYTGQEIVARMQYLGKLKKATFAAHINTSQPVNVGDAIYAQDTANPVGEVVNAVAYGDGYQVLMVLDKKSQNLPLFTSPEQDIAIELLDLPYSTETNQA